MLDEIKMPSSHGYLLFSLHQPGDSDKPVRFCVVTRPGWQHQSRPGWRSLLFHSHPGNSFWWEPHQTYPRMAFREHGETGTGPDWPWNSWFCLTTVLHLISYWATGCFLVMLLFLVQIFNKITTPSPWQQINFTSRESINSDIKVMIEPSVQLWTVVVFKSKRVTFPSSQDFSLFDRRLGCMRISIIWAACTCLRSAQRWKTSAPWSECVKSRPPWGNRGEATVTLKSNWIRLSERKIHAM